LEARVKLSMTAEEISDRAWALVEYSVRKQGALHTAQSQHRWDGSLKQYLLLCATEIVNKDYGINSKEEIAAYLASELRDSQETTELSNIKKAEAAVVLEAIATVLEVDQMYKTLKESTPHPPQRSGP